MQCFHMSNRWIVTAAHCLVFKQTIIAHLGLDAYRNSSQHYTVEPQSQHSHPSYKKETAPNYDIGNYKYNQRLPSSTTITSTPPSPPPIQP